MKYQLIKPVYDGTEVTLVARGEDGKKYMLSDPTHKSYFYLREDQTLHPSKQITAVEYADGRNRHDWIPFPSGGNIRGEPVKRIFVKKPTDVRELRELYDNPLEADIKYLRRYLIDRGITGGFNDDLEPVKFVTDPKIAVVDIEVYSNKKQNIKVMMRKANKSIVMIGIKFSEKARPIQLIFDKAEKRRGKVFTKDVIKIYFRSEIDLLIHYWIILKKAFPDVLSGWNVDFDIEYIKNRCEKLIKRLNDSMAGNKRLQRLKELLEENFMKYILKFDLMNAYNQLYEPVRKGLKFVEVDEGLKREVAVTGKSFAKVYVENQDQAETYNLEDVVNTWKINSMRKIIEFFWENKNFAGLEDLTGARYVGRLVDTITLRIARGRFALPSSPTYTEEEKKALEKFKGAAVLDVVLGIHENVGTFDFGRFYPTIMLAKKKIINFAQNLIPEVVEFLWKARDTIEEKMKALVPETPEWESVRAKFMSRKFTLNGVYGKVGDPKFRLYDRVKAGMITKYCRAGLKVLRKVAESFGFKVLAGDTDSIFIELSEKVGALVKDLEEIGRRLEERFNKVLQKVFLTKKLYVVLETIWNPVCFLEKKKSDDIAKKKYFGKIVWKDGVNLQILGKEKVVSKGMESVKRDTAKLTKVVMERLYYYILNNKVDHVLPYLKDVYQRMREGKFSIMTFAVGKGLSSNLKTYTSNIDYIRGSKYANKHIYKSVVMGAGVRAFMIFISRVLDPKLPKTDVIALEEPETDFDSNVFEIDWLKTMERVLEKPLESILSLTGLDWKKVKGQVNLSVLLE